MNNYLIIGANSPMVNNLIRNLNCMPNTFLTLIVRDVAKFNLQFEDLNLKNVEVYSCDLESDEIFEVLKKIGKVFRGVCYVAGQTNISLVRFIRRSDLNRIFEINYFKPLFITQSLLGSKSLVKGANLVYVSSLSGVGHVAPGIASYSTSKAALNNLIKVLALENSLNGYKFNTVCPGVVESNFNKDVNELKQDTDVMLRKRYPLGYGLPDDISSLLKYILLENTWINGQNIVIDGGFTAS